MKTYKLVNNLTGWFIFAIAAFTYCSTIEPTASFWDCPEFISTAYKMEIGHPPGAPFFMLVGKFFSLFASDATEVAKMINIMSALLSAGCILLLFWSVTHLAKKLLCRDDAESVSLGKTIAIMASGVGGALIYTWSDTFWFSAVEGEVYAFSSFFTALVFWLILKWEDQADEPHSDRWLVLIAYLIGLSIGVHLLNLLCIPAIVLVFYYKKWKNPSLVGSLAALGISVLIIIAVLYGIVPGIVKVGGWFELGFVNGLGLPFNSGFFVYLLLLVASLVYALYLTEKSRNRGLIILMFTVCTALLGIPFYGHGVSSVVIGIVAIAVLVFLLMKYRNIKVRVFNTALLCMTLMTVGYASYAVIVIRSTANPPMDQDAPEDPFKLGEYLGREQYGDRPLFWGPTYASIPVIETDENGGNPHYKTTESSVSWRPVAKKSADEPDRYMIANTKNDYVYPFDQSQLFPRIYSSSHASRYKDWLMDPSTDIVQTNNGKWGPQFVEIPTWWENMKYFFGYQVGFMYFRYFMWNFAGRQNDIQALSYGNEYGNWITGIPFIDDALYGDQENLPDELKNNKGRNVFYCLPLLLGLIGLFWQAYRGQRGIQQFWVVFFLFFMTGLAIVVYLNQTPGQPRERDYAYAGSFYAFAIWCGLGVTAIYDGLRRLLKSTADARRVSIVAASIAVIPAVAVPLQMVSQTWDDHDRSDRYMCRDFGLNYLQTVPQNGVIFTCGDNDTFPLWYNEDTEGNRTDVRVCNLSYLQTDWYIDQMRRPAYESEPLPISWQPYEYATVDSSDPNYRETIEVNPAIDYRYGSDGNVLRDADGRPMEITVEDYVNAFYTSYPDIAKKIWGDDPFELNNVIDKFVLGHTQDIIDELPREVREMVECVPKNCIPSDFVHIKVDKDAVRRSGMKIFGDSIPDYMEIDLRYRVGQQLLPRRQNPDRNKSVITKSYMMMLEMIARNNFKRPFYMSTTVGYDNYAELCQHFVLEGMAWRITPFTFTSEDGYDVMTTPAVDTEKMYKNMVEKYHYGNLRQKDLYIDETSMRMCNTHRRWFSILIRELVSEGKRDKALKALSFCEREIPEYNVPYNVTYGGLDIAKAYADCGKPERGNAILRKMADNSRQFLDYYYSLNNRHFSFASQNCLMNWQEMAEIMNVYKHVAEDETLDARWQKTYQDQFVQLYQYFMKQGEAYIVRCSDMGDVMKRTLEALQTLYTQVQKGWYFMSYEERYQAYYEEQMKRATEAPSDTTSPDTLVD